MATRAVVVITGRTLLQNAHVAVRPVRAEGVERRQQLHRRRAIGFRLLAADDVRQFQQAAGRARARDVVDALLVLRLAEIAVRQAVLADVGDEILRAFSRHIDVFPVARVDSAERKAIQRPRLRVADEPVVRAGGEQIHEADVVVEQHERAQFGRQQRLHAQRLVLIHIPTRGGVELPHHVRPETARPPAVAVIRRGAVAILLPHVGDDSLLGRALRAALHLFTGARKGHVNPFFHTSKPPSGDSPTHRVPRSSCRKRR